jgi:transposase-like protein
MTCNNCGSDNDVRLQVPVAIDPEWLCAECRGE